MNLIVHIFRKDVRHLYPEILMTLGLTAGFAWAAPIQWDYPFGGLAAVGGILSLLAPLLRILLPIAWLILIARLVHEESLLGDRQFWITRPIAWQTLLAAKLLFLLVFLYLPNFLMQCYLLHHASLGIVAALPDLLRYHLRLTALFFLPFFAIATVTSTFARQFLTVLVGITYVAGMFALGSNLMGRHLVAPGVQAAAGGLFLLILLAVILLQYARRRSRLSRFVLAGLPVFLLLVVLGAPAKLLFEHAYAATSPGTPYNLAFDPDPLRQQPGTDQPLVIDRNVVLSLPVQLRDLPPGLRLKGKGASLDLDTSTGFHWSAPYQQVDADLSSRNLHPAIDIFLPLAVFNRIRATPVDLHLSLVLEKSRTGAPQTVTAEPPLFAAPAGGNCILQSEGLTSNCLYALRPPPPIDISTEVSDQLCLGLPAQTSPAAQTRLAQTFIGSDDRFIRFDFDPVVTTPLRLWLNPATSGQMKQAYLCPGAPVTFTPHILAGRERLSMTQRGIVLAPYARHRMAGDTVHLTTTQIQPS